jgi:hypothetical protein
MQLTFHSGINGSRRTAPGVEAEAILQKAAAEVRHEVVRIASSVRALEAEEVGWSLDAGDAEEVARVRAAALPLPGDAHGVALLVRLDDALDDGDGGGEHAGDDALARRRLVGTCTSGR